MKREPRPTCYRCGKTVDTLPGSMCPHCITKQAKEFAAQRLAGQIPPKKK